MQSNSIHAKGYLNTLYIIFFALVFGQVMFGFVAFFFQSTQQVHESTSDLNSLLLYIVPFLVLAGIISSIFFYRSKLRSIRASSSLHQKLVDYRVSMIVKFAMLEVPSLVAIVAYLLTANIIFLGLAGIVILNFILERPSVRKLTLDLELSQKDKALFDDPAAYIYDDL